MNFEDLGECRHFVSYSGVKLPLKLVTPLTEADMGNRNTYFRGYFDAADRIVACHKVVYGEIEFEHRYHYHPNGVLRRAEIDDHDGEGVRVLEFDEDGRPVGD